MGCCSGSWTALESLKQPFESRPISSIHYLLANHLKKDPMTCIP